MNVKNSVHFFVDTLWISRPLGGAFGEFHGGNGGGHGEHGGAPGVWSGLAILGSTVEDGRRGRERRRSRGVLGEIRKTTSANGGRMIHFPAGPRMARTC